MAISGISNYRDVLYQWQGQQLKNTGSGSSGSSSSASALFSGTSMTSQISSMIELTKYAMDAMGVSADSRVTFSQITKYREQLQNEFNQSVKNGLASAGISNLADLSFSLDAKGNISVSGGTASDRKTAQAWLDANPSYGESLVKALEKEGMELDGSIEFQLSQTGKMTLVNTSVKSIQAALDSEEDLTENLRAALKNLGIEDSSIEFVFSENGALVVKGENEDARRINEWLEENNDIEKLLKKQLEKNDIDPANASLRLGKEGNLQVSINDPSHAEVQAVLDSQQEIGQKIATGLDNLGIDKNITFAIQVNSDGTINIVSDHPDRDKVQAFFEDNPELIKKYRQIETLAGIDDARKAMQVSPSVMRKRIQIESMAAWWTDSGNANSYFGNYSDGSLSLMAGLNLNV